MLLACPIYPWVGHVVVGLDAISMLEACGYGRKLVVSMQLASSVGQIIVINIVITITVIILVIAAIIIVIIYYYYCEYHYD